MVMQKTADVLIVGSGIAALIAADQLSDDYNVIIITKSKKEHSNSIWAQGGVAAAVSKDDSWKSHYQDTMEAGCYHNDEEMVKLLVRQGPSAIQKLIDGGMTFDLDSNGQPRLGKEGAHSKRRILHSGGDSTGKALITFLLNKVKNKVTILEDIMVTDLIVNEKQCLGVNARLSSGEHQRIYSNYTILATGGCGSLYTFTSNDPSVTGDGIAMAYRAGAKLADLEFVQFHPTMLSVQGKAKGLISEAVRGEGAKLIDETGKQIMEGVHPLKDLAPRDVVAREIHKCHLENKKVFLDISMIAEFESRFPTISAICRSNGIDLENKKIPVIPGAHFIMGGIVTDSNGQTSVPGLYAIGEVACTGVHGANRLASNSLLEGMVFGTEIAKHIAESSLKQHVHASQILPKEAGNYLNLKLPSKQQIKKIMTDYVGITRNEEGLMLAKDWIEGYARPFLNGTIQLESLTLSEIKIVNMLTTAWLITTSALERRESIGGHFRSDYPLQNDLQWSSKQIIRIRNQETLCPIV